MYTIKKVKTINAVQRDEWDALTRDNIFMCYAWMKTFEELSPDNSVTYVLVLKSGVLHAATACMFKERSKYYDLEGVLLGRAKSVTQALGMSFLPAFECGSVRGYGSHIVLRDGMSPEEQTNIVEAIFDTLEEMQRRYACPVYFNNVMRHEKRLIEALERRGFFKTFGFPVNYLDIEWNSFDEYKRHIQKMSPSMKGKLNHEINRNVKSGVVIRECRSIISYVDRLIELISMNNAKHGSVSTPTRKDFLQRLQENFGEDCIVYIAEKAGVISAVSITVKHGTAAMTPNVGVDYAIATKDFTYFNIAYYAPIRGAIDRKIRRFYYGNAAYKPKAQRGCKAEDVFIYYKPRNLFQKHATRLWFTLHALWMRRKLTGIKRVKA